MEASAMEETSTLTAIAVDKNRSSQLAVKWAVDNLLLPNSNCFLVHVTNKTMHPQHFQATPTEGRPPSEAEMQQNFLSSRGYCARKGIESHEVVIHGIDVPTALVDYINNNNIGNIVLGASTRNVLTRKLRIPDVPTSLLKLAPESCGVYVISKGKVQVSRSASRSLTLCKSTSTKLHKPRHLKTLLTKRALDTSEIEDSSCGRNVSIGKGRNYRITSDRINVSVQLQPCDKLKRNKPDPLPKASKRSKREEPLQRISIPERTILPGPSNCLSADPCAQGSDSTVYSSSSLACLTPRGLEDAMRRLQKELKSSMEMFKSVRKEAVAAKEKLRTLEEWKEAEERKLEEARLAEEEALALVEAEKLKIKVLRPDLSQGQKRFQQEVEVLSRMRHPHLVLLIGACPENGCLVYEYMENGSLEDRLSRKDNTPPIPWNTRFRIAAEIATGLLFIHQTKPEPLVHRDLKPANILLDQNYVSKISGVGLSRLVPATNSVTQHRLTQPQGTFFYIDPEYQQTGMLSVKSDLYSFGVILLQLITLKPPVGLAFHVHEAIEKGTFAEMLDPAVPDWPVEEALSLAKLALQCCELRKRDRPDLDSVVLPELNRLRNLGLEYEANKSENVASQSPIHNSLPENRSLETQKPNSNIITKSSSRQRLKSMTSEWKSSILPSNGGPAQQLERAKSFSS